MTTKVQSRNKQKSHSILAYSHGATRAFRFFSKEDFLHMMCDMSLADIINDMERFKSLEEYEICNKLMFVIREKRKTEDLSVEAVFV